MYLLLCIDYSSKFVFSENNIACYHYYFYYDCFFLWMVLFSNNNSVGGDRKNISEYFSPLSSSIFFNNVVVPHRAVFCINGRFIWMSNLPSHFSKLFVTPPRAPITIGIARTFLIFQILPFSVFKSWCFSCNIV